MTCFAWLVIAFTGWQVPAPVVLPPPDSPPLVRTVEIAFPTQGNVSAIDPATYLFYIKTMPSRPTAGVWTPYDSSTVLDDFKRLWATGFLDNMWIEVKDAPYPNGIEGKHIVFNLEERQRVKIVDYTGSKVLEQSKIEEKLRDENLQLRIDSFIDPGIIRRTESIVRGMFAEKGYEYAEVGHTLRSIEGDPKLVTLTFNLSEGPKVRIRQVEFVGNKAVSDRQLRRRLKFNKPEWFLSFLTQRGTYQATKLEEDADRLTEHYRNHGYVTTRIGQPTLKPIGDSKNGKTRYVALEIPVQEGERFRIGAVSFDGNTVLKPDALTRLFPLRTGRYYDERRVRKALEKAREVYGSAGYYEFTGYPDLAPHGPQTGEDTALAPTAPGPPTVDVTMRLQEGKQYFIHRIEFTGNTTTRDRVIRREMALLEGGVFNVESLKYTVKRLNQLGYFKPLEGTKDVKVDKTPGADNTVDVTLKLEEQNRNQLNFGAGMSQYDGFFGTFSYTAANFLGRGEGVTVALQRGSRSNLYQVSINEPYLFDQPMSASFDLYSRKNNYYTAVDKVGYSEVREGATFSMGRPLRRFMHGYFGYTYEVIHISISNDLLKATSGASLYGLPSFNLGMDSGRHVDSRVMPALSYSTIDQPIFPRSGIRVTLSGAVASEQLGGSYNYAKPEGEAVVYVPIGRRMSLGVRGQGGWLRMYGSTKTLPYYLRYFLGGETQIRGVDIRSVGPIDQYNRSLGGNKFMLFNAELGFDIVSQARFLLFHDAGQAFSEAETMDVTRLRTSSGAELRVMVPMLNVPFRLIYALNLYRDIFQPKWAFKFAVGTTF
jgi:outer membrane protein insertion porin family